MTTDPQRAARARILPDNWKVPVFGGLGAGLAVVAGAVIDEVTDSVALRILTMVLVILGVKALGRRTRRAVSRARSALYRRKSLESEVSVLTRHRRRRLRIAALLHVLRHRTPARLGR